MKYDFDTVIDRRNSGSLKWDVGDSELPMWVADMDFRTAPEILTALQKRLDHGIFGYSVVPDAWYDAIRNWWNCRHGFAIEKDWLIFCTGVVPAISSTVRKLTAVGDYILLQTPVYNIFFNSIVNNGRKVLESPLIYEDGVYRIDFDDLESKLALPQTTMMILCNPHNPIGKIWDRETLRKIGELCKANHVTVLSDEIHCDLTDPGKSYLPFASVSETCRDNSVTCIAPTKAFNIAGLQTAAVVVPNPSLRHKVNRGLNTDEVAEPNAFAIAAAVAAFEEGGGYLEALRDYLYRNKERVRAFLKTELPMVKAVPSEATYLLWLDCGEITADTAGLADFLRKTVGLYVSKGGQYGASGKQFLRLNVACPRQLLEDGLCRLRTGVTAYLNSKR